MAEQTEIFCALERGKVSLCHPPADCDECHRCGWEQTEALQRKAAIRAVWEKPYMETGEYCLKLRKEKKHD